MGKGKSWGVANEIWARSGEAAARREVAELTGVLHRVAGLLGCVASVDSLSDWCQREEARRREERERTPMPAVLGVIENVEELSDED